MPEKTEKRSHPRTPIFVCPFCEKYTAKGGNGKTLLNSHVATRHAEQVMNYNAMPLDDIRYFQGEEQPALLSRRTKPSNPSILTVNDPVQKNQGPPQLSIAQ